MILPPSFWNAIIPNADPHKAKARRIGTTFNLWLKKANVKGIIGENIKPVIAPSINKLVPVKPMIHTKINQVIARHKPPNQTILRHVVTDKNTDTIAKLNRPI